MFDELTNLSKLDLSRNDLSEIRDNQFARLQKLLYLDINHNFDRIQFRPLSFAGLSHLKYLSLDRIRIRKSISLPNDAFEPLHTIEELHLVGFCIDLESYHYHQENISENLSKLSTLRKLYVDNFVVSSLDTGFSALVNLEELKFDGRYAGRFRIDAFSMSTFENLRNSQISTLVMDNYETKNISPFTFSYFGNLTALHLINLELSDWCEGYFDVETGLQNTNTTHMRLQLRCQGRVHWLNSIQGIERTPLETLDLSDGSITYIDSSFFYNLPVSLKYLYPQGNSIENVEFYHLQRLQNLKFLDLSEQIHLSQNLANDTQDVEISYNDISRTDEGKGAVEDSDVSSRKETNQAC